MSTNTNCALLSSRWNTSVKVSWRRTKTQWMKNRSMCWRPARWVAQTEPHIYTAPCAVSQEHKIDVHLNTSVHKSTHYQASSELKAKKPAARGEPRHLLCCLLTTSLTLRLREAAPSTGHVATPAVKTHALSRRFMVRGVQVLFTQNRQSWIHTHTHTQTQPERWFIGSA